MNTMNIKTGQNKKFIFNLLIDFFRCFMILLNNIKKRKNGPHKHVYTTTTCSTGIS